MPPPIMNQPKRSGFAVVSLVLGVVALLFAWQGNGGTAALAFPIGILAVILGALGAVLIRWGKSGKTGTRQALGGLALGIVAFVVAASNLIQGFNPQRGPSGWNRSQRSQIPDMPRPDRVRRTPLTNFASRLPVVVLHTGGRPVWQEGSTLIRAEFYEAGKGPGTSETTPNYLGPATLNRRGYSSLRLPKPSFTLHTVDASTNQIKVPLLGMPKGEDWVLYAPFEDKTLIRDVLAYELARKMGHYAPRTRFVEVFVNNSAGPVAREDYEGVYVLVEKIKRGADRVNIAKLEPTHRAEPEITGGYILKRDHRERDGRRFHTPNGGPYFHVYPNDRDITPEQRTWIQRYLTAFENALHGPDFADPSTGYAAFLDVDSFIDAHWLIELSKNVDGFRYSSFLTKDRGGKLKTEPPWDWNRAFGNANYYGGGQSEGWYWTRLRPNEISWHARLREDPAYVERASARWRALRTTTFDPAGMHAFIDQCAAELEGAQQRNFERWPVLGQHITCNYYVGRTYQDEIRWLKGWIDRRIAWIDSQVGLPPAQ